MLNNLIRRETSTQSSSDRKKFSNNSFIFTKGRTFKYFNRIRNRVPNLGTDSREKDIHFIRSRELNIKRVARDRSCSVVMNLTCFFSRI